MISNISMHVFSALLQIFALAFCALLMHGQTANTGAIAGSVSDPSGALVPSAALAINSQVKRVESLRFSLPTAHCPLLTA